MSPEEKSKLTEIVEKYAKLNADIQAKRWDQKALAESAWEKCGVEASVVKQLAKESAFDDVKKEKQRQYEESLHQCRALLGVLLDTPLGRAAIGEENSADAEEQQPAGKASGKTRSRTNGRSKKPEAVAATH